MKCHSLFNFLKKNANSAKISKKIKHFRAYFCRKVINSGVVKLILLSGVIVHTLKCFIPHLTLSIEWFIIFLKKCGKCANSKTQSLGLNYSVSVEHYQTAL